MKNCYTLLKGEPYTEGNYQLISLRKEDIHHVRSWRNEQMDVLRQDRVLTFQDQERYFTEIIEPSYAHTSPNLILFSFLHSGELIGYGGIVHINWQSRRGEVSFLTPSAKANDLAAYTQDFLVFLKLLQRIAIEDLNIRRLTTETFDIRPHVIEILERSGFIQEGVLRNHNFIDGKFIDSILHSWHPSDSQEILEGQENVLVTSISKKIPLLELLKGKLKKLSPESLLIGCDADKNCMGKSFVDLFWNCPRDAEFGLDLLLSFCKEKKIHYILPTRDGELSFFASNAEALKKENIHVMISPLSAIQICLDKELFSSHVTLKTDIPVIPTSSELEDEFGERIVVKERFSSGSKDIGLNLSSNEALDHAKQLQNPVFQPYIRGKEYSVDMYLSYDSKILAAITRSRDIVINGESQATTIQPTSPLQDHCLKLAEFLGLKGHVVFQGIVDLQGNPHIIECNCRIGGASTLSMRHHINTLQWFMQESKTGSISRGESLGQQISPGISMIRKPQDIFYYRSSKR